MRSSDWSSDVCSSDLGCPPGSEPGSERARSDGGSADDLSEVVSGERLGQQELSACADRLLTHLGGGFGRDEPEAYFVPCRPKGLQELDPVHVGHVPVAEDQVGLLGLDGGEGFGAVGGLTKGAVSEAGLATGAGDKHAPGPAVVEGGRG